MCKVLMLMAGLAACSSGANMTISADQNDADAVEAFSAAYDSPPEILGDSQHVGIVLITSHKGVCSGVALDGGAVLTASSFVCDGSQSTDFFVSTDGATTVTPTSIACGNGIALLQTGLQTSAMSVDQVSVFVGQSLLVSGYRTSADAASGRYLQWVSVTAVTNDWIATTMDSEFSAGTALIQPATGDVVGIFDAQNALLVTPDEIVQLQPQFDDGSDASSDPPIVDAGTIDDSDDDAFDDALDNDDSSQNLGAFGDPCEAPADCASGLCVEVCTRACGEAGGRCPNGYWCTNEDAMGNVCAPHD